MATSSERQRTLEGSDSAPFGFLLSLAVPTLLLLVHSLPRGVRRGLALEFADPTITAAFTAHFVHLSTAHLFSNLILYALVVSTAYLLARRLGDLRTFRRGFLTVLVVFPPVLSGLSVALGRPALGYGFSGLNMALFGLLTVLLSRFLVRRFGFPVDGRGVVLFGVGVVLVALWSLPVTGATLAVAGSAACLSLASVVARLRGRSSHATDRPKTAGGAGEYELVFVAAVLFCVLPFVAFSAPSTVAAALGLYVHFLGYALAFTVLYVADAAGLLA
jgi:hypothetical protein